MNIQRKPIMAALAAVVVAASLLVAGSTSAANGRGDSRNEGAQNLGSPDYGVCRGTDPRCYHDWHNFDPATDGYRVLVYSRTAGPRHANLGPALPAGLNPPLTEAHAAQNFIIRLGQENGFAVDWTEDVTQLNSPARLLRYNAVIFFSTTRDTLDDPAQTALRQYIRGGGGFVGIHNAFGTEYNWEWYEGLIGGANYYDHGANQVATVKTVNKRDVSTAGLPETWTFTDEWYNLVPFPSQVRFLATVDENTMATKRTAGHPGHGDFHPVTWCQYYDGGRSWVTTMGHDARAFLTDGSFAGAEFFQKMVLGGIESAMGKRPFCR
ncbi:glycosyl hydrolase [Rhizocola hellebori]|uniref:Glycosyl hydrolase n=1 Tax=Rhizocola hellebori TaxID=1392758 RepID=A0A8J3VID4_9ACTN|nr:ThuA domain-containing protein [Rhizocola hellebori]GIH06941.1 glycosyl hydrolase [Rhizocola hellebori]